MKNLFVLAAFALLSLSANAQQASAFEHENSDAVSTETAVKLNPNYFENSAILGTPTPKPLFSESVMSEEYKQSSGYYKYRALRNWGIGITAAGLAEAGVFLAATIDIAANTDDNPFSYLGSGIGQATCVTYALIGGGVAAGGLAMWIIGQKKMNKIKAASSGLGLAFQF